MVCKINYNGRRDELRFLENLGVVYIYIYFFNSTKYVGVNSLLFKNVFFSNFRSNVDREKAKHVWYKSYCIM